MFALHFGNRRIFLGETLHEQFRLSEAAIPVRQVMAGSVQDFVVGLVILEIAMAVTFGDAGALQGAFGLVACSAITRHGPNHLGLALREGAGLIGRKRLRAFFAALHDFPSATLAMGTIRLSHDRRISGARRERKHATL